jgi:hypothetical protein
LWPGKAVRPIGPEDEIAGLPEHETGEWSRHSDLNRGPAVYETAALPLSYVGVSASIGDEYPQRLFTSRLRCVDGSTIDATALEEQITSDLP